MAMAQESGHHCASFSSCNVHERGVAYASDGYIHQRNQYVDRMEHSGHELQIYRPQVQSKDNVFCLWLGDHDLVSIRKNSVQCVVNVDIILFAVSSAIVMRGRAIYTWICFMFRYSDVHVLLFWKYDGKTKKDV